MKAVYDLVIRGGTLVTPEKIFRGDLGIVGEKIAAVGTNLSGITEIDATGKLVLPGDRKSTRLNSSHTDISRMPSSA